MVALVANRVKESTATTGTGTINLGGAETGFIAFSDTFTTADTVHYIIEDGNNWEYGIGTLTTGTPWTLARTTVLETLVSGTFDDTSPTAITLSGSAIVGVGPVTYPPGSIVGSNITENSSYTACTTTIPADDTIPQNTEGTEIMTVAYTPKYADSLLRVSVLVKGTCPGNQVGTVALFRDSTADALKATRSFWSNTRSQEWSLYAEVSATAATSTTFKVRCGPHSSGTLEFNGDGASSRTLGGVNCSYIRVEEIRQ